MLQLLLSDEQFYGLLKCNLYWRFDGISEHSKGKCTGKTVLSNKYTNQCTHWHVTATFISSRSNHVHWESGTEYLFWYCNIIIHHWISTIYLFIMITTWRLKNVPINIDCLSAVPNYQVVLYNAPRWFSAHFLTASIERHFIFISIYSIQISM